MLYGFRTLLTVLHFKGFAHFCCFDPSGIYEWEKVEWNLPNSTGCKLKLTVRLQTDSNVRVKNFYLKGHEPNSVVVQV